MTDGTVHSYSSLQENAASSHIGEHHQKSDNTRHKGQNSEGGKYVYLLMSDPIQFNFNCNIVMFN
jgi:hypothetical protein